MYFFVLGSVSITQLTVSAQLVLSGQPGVSVVTCFSFQAVLTESVHLQGNSKFPGARYVAVFMCIQVLGPHNTQFNSVLFV